ncbi:MAG: hypothetical protein H0W83_10115 [Planctomycetes bacterium]|nr:hypothetical protein [Planctomycetota bacterium]
MTICRCLFAIAIVGMPAISRAADEAPIAGPPPADAALEPAIDVPADLRERVAAAEAAHQRRDDAEAYQLLQELRTDPRFDHLTTAAAAIDQRRNRLAAHLAQELITQAEAQARDGRPLLAEKFYRQALAYRAAAGSDLERFVTDHVSALGGAAEVALRLQTLSDGTDEPESLRWRLRTIGLASNWAMLDEQHARLQKLVRLAGDADDDVRAFTHEATSVAERLLRQHTSTEVGAAAHGEHVLADGRRILGAADPTVSTLAHAVTLVQRRDALLRFGRSENAFALRISAWRPTIGGSFHASATPASTTGGFANASASTALAGSDLGTRIELQWLREPSPIRGRDGFVFGAMVAATSANLTTDLVLADPDTGAASLQNQHFSSAIGVRSLGLDGIAGWRFGLGGEDSPWSLQTRAYAGLHALQMRYGTRRGAVDGSATSRTEDANGYLAECGADVEAAWRFTARWAAVGTLGYLYGMGSVDAATGSARFVNTPGTTTTTGSYEESFESLRLSGPYVGLGLRAAF